MGKKFLDLLNFEGPVLKLHKANKNEFVIYDQWDSIVDVLTLKELFSFLDGDLELTDSQGKKWNWAKQHKDAKPSMSKLFMYLNTGYTKKDLEKSFYAGREVYSKLTWSDETVDEFTYGDFDDWINKNNT